MNIEKLNHKRKMFELLPEVRDKLSRLHPTIIWFGDDGMYHTSFDFKDTVNWLNGAFYAFGKKYKTIDDLKKEEKQLDDAKGWDAARDAMFRSRG